MADRRRRFLPQPGGRQEEEVPPSAWWQTGGGGSSLSLVADRRRRFLPQPGGRQEEEEVPPSEVTSVCHFPPSALLKVRSEEPVVTASLPEAQQPMRGSRGRYHASCRPSPAATSSPDPSCLDTAQLHTSLALKAELLSLKGEEFDSEKAVQGTLQRSERTKHLIDARAAEVVNVSRSQKLFTSLVSVSVQEDQLISQVLQDKLLLAPPPCIPLVATTSEAPSLLVFRTSDQPRQKPLPQEEEPATRQPVPTVRPATSTFDLFRRQRCWEATP